VTSLRKDDGLQSTLSKEAEEHCDWIIENPGIKNDRSTEDLVVSARAIKGELLSLSGDYKTAIHEYEAAIAYYERQGASFYLLQALLMMCSIQGEFKDELDDEFRAYLSRIVEVTFPYKTQFEKDPSSLSKPEKNLLVRSCRFMSFYLSSDPKIAMEWLFTAFDVYVSMNLFGHAILLDDLIMRQLKDGKERADYEERLREISQHLAYAKFEKEQVDWNDVSGTLQRHFSIERPVTQHLEHKQDFLTTGTRRLEDGDEEGAIVPLADGIALSDPENPEEIDFVLLEKLREAYRMTGKHEKVPGVDRLRQELSDVRQSRDYLRLAENCREDGWDPLWALSIATDVKNKGSQYYKEAYKQLEAEKKKRQSNQQSDVSDDDEGDARTHPNGSLLERG